MQIDFSSLNEIPKIIQQLNSINKKIDSQVTKRWLNTNELALYTGYKLETIKAKIKKGDFILGLHYYKREGKLLFDRTEVDNWVMGINSHVSSNTTDISNIVDSIIEDIKVS